MQKKILLHFKNHDTVIFELLTKYHKELKLNPASDHFLALVESIISQQLSLKAGQTIINRFESLFKNSQINANNILEKADLELRTVGMSWSKVAYVKNIATAVVSKQINFSEFENLSDVEIVDKLTKIKGIGNWTAEMFLIFAMGREDVFSFGDIGLQNAIQKNYKLTSKPTKAYMEQLSGNWQPYKTYAALALWESLDNSNL